MTQKSISDREGLSDFFLSIPWRELVANITESYNRITHSTRTQNQKETLFRLTQTYTHRHTLTQKHSNTYTNRQTKTLTHAQTHTCSQV